MQILIMKPILTSTMLYYENFILVVNGSKRMLDIVLIKNYVGAK
jgi:hypothetical protein